MPTAVPETLSRSLLKQNPGTARERAPLRECYYTADHSPLPIVAVEGMTHVIVYMNAAFRRLVRKETNALIGRPIADVLPQRNANTCLPFLDRVYRTGQAESLADQEHRVSHSQPVYWSYTMWPIPPADERPAGVMLQITDTTEATRFRHEMISLNETLLQSDVRLQALVMTDGLTGLKNYRAFHERLSEEVARAVRYATPLSVLLMDVDDFKGYNDTYGHPAGDVALRKVGELLQTTARANDLVARYGGEEFGVILPETDAKSARLAAERFRSAVEAANWSYRQITVSVGVATVSSGIRDPAILLNQADEALYGSKRRGRNCVTHSLEVSATRSQQAG